MKTNPVSFVSPYNKRQHCLPLSQALCARKMKLSNFEIEVIEALVQGDQEEKAIRAQLDGATVKKRVYTGMGLYTEILVLKNRDRINKSNRYIDETPKAHLEHPGLNGGAGALLWFDEGYVSTLECFTYEGNSPKDESLFKVIA